MVDASRFARLAAASFEANETEILNRYSRELDAAELLAGGRRASALADARFLVAECVGLLRSLGSGRPARSHPAQVPLERLALTAGVDTRESVYAAHLMFAVLATALIEVLAPEGGAVLAAVLLRLNDIIATRTASAVTSVESLALEKLREEHKQDRLECAREVHDEIGSVFTLALRNLDLHDFYEEKGMYSRAEEKAVVVRRVLLDGVDISRRLARDLREPVALPELEVALKTLVRCFDDPSVAVEIVVLGDESRVPDAIRYQVFSMIRECLRNSFAYSGSDSVCVLIRIDESEIHASVEDTGAGMDPHAASRNARTFGLRSITERAELHGGGVLVSSSSGEGTRVEIVLPLTENGGDGD